MHSILSVGYAIWVPRTPYHSTHDSKNRQPINTSRQVPNHHGAAPFVRHQRPAECLQANECPWQQAVGGEPHVRWVFDLVPPQRAARVRRVVPQALRRGAVRGDHDLPALGEPPEGKEGAGGGGAGGGRIGSEEQQQPMAVEQPPHQSKTHEWIQQPNVSMEIKPPTGTKFNDPIDIWKCALERERHMSKEYFKLLQMARESNDFVTEQFTLKQIKEQHREEQALEEILENAQLVTKRGPELYFEMDKALPSKPH